MNLFLGHSLLSFPCFVATWGRLEEENLEWSTVSRSHQTFFFAVDRFDGITSLCSSSRVKLR